MAMGRNRKKGLDYYPFDVDFFQDIKIRKLIKRQGGKAVTVYALLLCLIYKSGYYIVWDKELPFVISEQTGFEEAYIQQAIECCLSLGLFDANMFKSSGVITSKGIQERYQSICLANRRQNAVTDYSLLDESPMAECKPVQANKNEDKLPSEDAVFAKMKSSKTWLNELGELYDIPTNKALAYIDEFKLSCKVNEKVHGNLKEAKQHFNNWLRIQLSKNNGQKKSDKYRAAKTITEKPQDYKTTF